MSVVTIAREYFPDADDAEIDHLIWDETGFPCFWEIPLDGATPEDCFRMQLARAAAREHFGEYGYFAGEKQMELALAAPVGEADS